MGWYRKNFAAVKIDRKTGLEYTVDDNKIDHDIYQQYGEQRGTANRALMREDYNSHITPSYQLTINDLFFDYIVPKTKQLYPNSPLEHYSLDAFQNISRYETGLDNRRRDTDQIFVNAGKEIKELTERCRLSFGTPNFDRYLTALVKRIHKWYFEESPSRTLTQKSTRQIDYRLLHDLGIDLQPEDGKILSRNAQPNSRLQQLRDEFISAYNIYEKTSNPLLLQRWWRIWNNNRRRAA